MRTSSKSGLLGILMALAFALFCSPALQASPPPAQDYYHLWTHQYVTPLFQAIQPHQTTAVAVDHLGNVIVTGFSLDQNTSVRSYYTAKYDAVDGHQDWVATYSPGHDAFANSVAIDSQNNVYVGGGAQVTAGNEDFYLIKYNSSGTQQWAREYNGTANGQDEIRKVIVDPSDNVIVTGISAGASGANLDFETIKYNSGGTLQWANRLNYDNEDDVPAGLACDSNGNIVVVGAVVDTSFRTYFYTIRYTAAGSTSWAQQYLPPGDGYGATAVAVDSTGDVITTGHYVDASNNDGFYTVKYNTAGTQLWDAVYQSGSSDDHAGGAKSVAVDANNNVIVTGNLNNGQAGPANEDQIYTVKYTSGGFFGNGFIDWAIVDSGTNSGGPTHAVQVTTDQNNNAVLIGDAYNGDDQDIYLAAYASSDGHNVLTSYYPGDFGADDVGVGVAIDSNNNLVAAGNPIQNNGSGTGLYELAAFKYNHRQVFSGDVLLQSGESLPATAGLTSPTVFSLDPPALDDLGGFATLLTANSGKAKVTAIYTQDYAGNVLLPAVQKTAAPGAGLGTYSLFSDPVMAPDGTYAFAARLAGVPPAKAYGVWTNMGGSLSLYLRTGTQIPDASLPSTTVTSINSISMRSGQLIALIGVSGPPATRSMLLSIDSFDNGTSLVRAGDGVFFNGNGHTIKTITVLSPTLLSPTDGRWQGDMNTVVKIATTDRQTAICTASPTFGLTPLLYTGQDASAIVPGTTYKAFGLPGVGSSGTNFTVLATLSLVKGSDTVATDAADVFSPDGASFSSYLQKGASPTDLSLGNVKFAALTDPLVDANGALATIVTLAGKGVTAKNNKALMYGSPSGLSSIARLGQPAPDYSGVSTSGSYAAFISLALPNGLEPAPIFVAKLAGVGINAKNNLGLWAYDSTGLVRRLLRIGDSVNGRTVSAFTILKNPSKDFTAPRNFSAIATVALKVNFTDRTQALVAYGIP